LFRVSEEVHDAISTNKPVVALETAIYTHGYPSPSNRKLASDIEQIIRSNGAIPATIGLLNGQAIVGLSSTEMDEIASSAGSKSTVKVSRRDLAYLTGLPHLKLNGGTTIAATMILAHKAGIKVFATGGLGGVHRGAERTMDISADLTELGRTPVAVISAGMKSFLDFPMTLEILETQGVFVSTFGSRSAKVDVPAFFSRNSGIKSPNTVETAEEAAHIIRASHSLKLTSGQLFFNPIPVDDEIPKEEMDGFIAAAVESAKHIIGKDNTPYVLNQLIERSEGRSLKANTALVLNNALMGAKVACELAKLSQ